MSTWSMGDVVHFAQQRHTAWAGGRVTDDVVRCKKFTNVFRVLDRGSQYLLRLMNDYEDTIDRLAVSYLYRQVNRPDSMNAIIKQNGNFIPCFDEITDPDWIREVVAPVIDRRPGEFLNGAYIILIMTNDKRNLKEKMMDIFPQASLGLMKVAEQKSLESRVKSLQKIKGLGPFLSMQIATDLGYCKGEADQENDYILPGPGARKGAKAIGMSALKAIHQFPTDEIPPLPHSNGRPASLMDVQNVFCEFSKYVRFKERGLAVSDSYHRHTPFEVQIPEQFVLPV